MNRVMAIALALLALLLLMWLTVLRTGPAVEADLGQRVADQLAVEDLSQVAVTVDGQEIYLRGTLVNESLREHALTIAAEQWGVTQVHDNLQVITAAPIAATTIPNDAQPTVSGGLEQIEPSASGLLPVPSLEIEFGDRLSVRGRVADTATRDALLHEIDSTFTGKLGDSELSVDSRLGTSVTNSGLQAVLAAVLPHLAALTNGRLTVQERSIELSGVVAEFADKARIVSAVNEDQPAGYTLDIAIDAPVATTDSCQALFDEMLMLETIEFGTNSADIAPASLPLLRRLVSVLDSCGFAVEVGGHTDATGDEVYNQWLSERRAEAVSAYLVANSRKFKGNESAEAAVDSAKVKAIGYGESKPLADNTTRQGRAANRRIEFNVRRVSP